MEGIEDSRKRTSTRRLAPPPRPRARQWGPAAVAALCVAVMAIVATAWFEASSDSRPAQTEVCETSADCGAAVPVRDCGAAIPARERGAGVPARAGEAQASSAEPTSAEWAAKILSDWRTLLTCKDRVARPGEWEELRHYSFAALKKLGPDAAVALEHAALDGAEALVVRTTALEALSEVDSDHGVETALVLVQPSQPVSLRTAAILALIPPRDDRVLTVLEGVLAERTFDGRYLAATALGRRRDAEAIPTLERALTSDPSVTVRCHAAAALADLRDPQAWEPLARALRGEASSTVRERIAAALACLDPVRSAPLLQELAGGDASPGVRRTASALLSPGR